MPEPTRRGFLATTAGGAAALAAMNLIDNAQASTGGTGSLDTDGPLVAYVADPRSGRVVLFAGNGSRTMTDHRLVSEIRTLVGRR